MKTRLKRIINNRIFRIVVLCGGAGVALDIDHPIHFYLIPELDGRFLHTPALYICSSIIACLLLYATVIYIQSLVRKAAPGVLPDIKLNITPISNVIIEKKTQNNP
jgi:hypothetical protein